MTRYVLTGAQVFSGVPSRKTRRSEIAIEGDRISAVAPHVQRGPEDQEIDLQGCTILPGLINLHEHLTMKRTFGPPAAQAALSDAYLVIRGVRAALRDLREGVTTVRELGARNGLNIVLKRAVINKAIPGPRILAAGPFLSVTGGHASEHGRTADGPEGIRRAVREIVSEGAEWIKLIATNDPIHQGLNGQHTHPEFTPAEIRAAVDEARRWSAKVAVHAMGTKALKDVIEAQPDSIEHGIYLDATLAREMAHRGIALVPTLSGYSQTFLPEWGRGADWAVRHRLLTEPHRTSFRVALDEGVTIGIGTDTLGDYVEELQLMVNLGMTQNAALEAATRTNAGILGLGDEIGTIVPGRVADLVAVRGDPLLDLEALRDVALVVQGGIPVRPDEVTVPTGDETADWNTLAVAERGRSSYGSGV